MQQFAYDISLWETMLSVYKSDVPTPIHFANAAVHGKLAAEAGDLKCQACLNSFAAC
jgi:hypothetical protein